MEKIGIICEYNPFHNGHLYHLNYIQKNYKDALIILVMSGEFTERGDLSILNKWEKTNIALEYGIDLVVELPYKYACQSASLFAFGAIKILNELSVNKIVFGSEENNIDKLKEYAKKQLDNEYQEKVFKNLANGYNYPQASSLALDDLLFNKPNDILGLCYIREIIKNNYNIEPISIKRTNDYNSLELTDKIASATSIREALNNNKNIKKYVPKITYEYLNKKRVNLDDYFIFLKYRIISEQKEINKYHLVDEKILSRILKYINCTNNFDDLILKIKSKNITYNHVKRILINILLGITKEDIKNDKDYIRVLGFNKTGKNYLNSIKKDLTIPLITSYRNNKNNELNINTKITNILMLKNDNLKCEYTNSPIIKK